MLLLQHERSVPNQLHRQVYAELQSSSSQAEDPGRDLQHSDHRARDTRAFRVCVDSTRAVGVMTKRSLRLFLPSTAIFLVSSTLAYGLSLAVVGASTNSIPTSCNPSQTPPGWVGRRSGGQGMVSWITACLRSRPTSS